MDSFYGGKPGISFIIKDSFTSIDKMNEAFEQPDYTKVWYDEYCIINTVTTNHIDNGKIFRRTGRKAKEEHGTRYAEYIGRITGPAGGTPNVQLDSIENLQDNFDHLKTDFDTQPPQKTIYYQKFIPAETEGQEDTYEYSSTFPSSVATPSTLLNINSDKTNIIYKSGKDYYNATPKQDPAFKYGFYTVQGAPANGATDIPDATLAIGFEIPYVDFATPTVELISANEQPSITVETLNSFYYQHKFKIPNGLPGAYITDIHSVPVTGNQIYDIQGLTLVPGATVPYELPESAMSSDDFSTANVLVGHFKYPTRNTASPWEYVRYNATTDVPNPTPALFYISDNPALPTFEVKFDTVTNRYKLYVKNEGQDTSQEIGTVGPQSYGLTGISLHGHVTDWQADGTSETETVIIDTSAPTGNGQGNIGILSTADIWYEPRQDHPEDGNGNYNVHNENFIYLYIYEANEWHKVGKGVTNESANLNCTAGELSILNSSTTVYLSTEAVPSDATNIDTFENDEDITWK